MRTVTSLVLLAACLIFSTFAQPALAQRDRVFVASYGSDSNPCTFGSPCKTFQVAYNVVAVGGEVTAIDSAGFGPILIQKSVTITSPAGVEAGIAAPANNPAITISAGESDNVSLRGLTLEGAVNSVASGVNVVDVGNLDVVDCVIRGFLSGAGINFQPSSQMTATISNTYLSNNNIGLNTESLNAPTNVTLDHVTMTKNSTGIYIFAQNGNGLVTIANSDFSHNGIGVDVGSEPGNNNSNLVTLRNDTFSDNTNAIRLDGTTALALSHVIDAYSVNGSINFNDPRVTTYSEGDNHVSLVGPHAPQSLGVWPQQ
jgi:hypothetical protein